MAVYALTIRPDSNPFHLIVETHTDSDADHLTVAPKQVGTGIEVWSSRWHPTLILAVDEYGAVNGATYNPVAHMLYGGSPIAGPVYVFDDNGAELDDQLVDAVEAAARRLAAGDDLFEVANETIRPLTGR